MTKRLNNGIEVLAKFYDGRPSALMFANLAQAKKRVNELGAGWRVYQSPSSRVFYVAKADQFKLGNPVNGKSGKGQLFTPEHLARLQKEFATVAKVDPDGEYYKKLRRYIASLTVPILNQIAGAKINWLTNLARRELDQRRKVQANPVRARSRRLSSGKTRVRGRKRILSLGTTQARAGRQIRKLRAMRAGWKPKPGIPARDARKKAAALGRETIAWRKGRKWTVARGSVKAGKFQVLAKSLTDTELKKWYRSHGYTAKSI
jgi:hypothetical protein